MDALKTAIYSKVTTKVGGNYVAFYNDISGRFYYRKAPTDDVIKPYCVFYLLDENYDYTFQATEEFEYIPVQFNIYDDDEMSSNNTIEGAVNNCKSLFDWCSLTVAGYILLYMRREFVVPPEWLDDEKVWRVVLHYQVALQKA